MMSDKNQLTGQGRWMSRKQLSFVAVVTVLLLTPMILKPALAQSWRAPDGFSYFFNMRFWVYFPTGWSVIENIPNSVEFSTQDLASQVIISWDAHIQPWILDKSAWIQNMTKQGIIIDKIDNTTTIANHTALQISFTDSDFRYSVVVIKTNDLALSFVYFTHTNDFPLYEDKANAMLGYLHLNKGRYAFQDSHCTYSTLFNQFDWWPLWHGGSCEGDNSS